MFLVLFCICLWGVCIWDMAQKWRSEKNWRELVLLLPQGSWGLNLVWVISGQNVYKHYELPSHPQKKKSRNEVQLYRLKFQFRGQSWYTHHEKSKCFSSVHRLSRQISAPQPWLWYSHHMEHTKECARLSNKTLLISTAVGQTCLIGHDLSLVLRWF